MTTDQEETTTQNRRWMRIPEALDYMGLKDPRALKKLATAAGAAAQFGKMIYIDRWKLDTYMMNQMEQNQTPAR